MLTPYPPARPPQPPLITVRQPDLYRYTLHAWTACLPELLGTTGPARQATPANAPAKSTRHRSKPTRTGKWWFTYVVTVSRRHHLRALAELLLQGVYLPVGPGILMDRLQQLQRQGYDWQQSSVGLARAARHSRGDSALWRHR